MTDEPSPPKTKKPRKPRRRDTKPRVKTSSACIKSPHYPHEKETKLFAEVRIGDKLGIRLTGANCVEHANALVDFLTQHRDKLQRKPRAKRPTQLTLHLDLHE